MKFRRPIIVPTDEHARRAFRNGATLEEWTEFRRTNIITVSMHVKWWCRRTLRKLR